MIEPYPCPVCGMKPEQITLPRRQNDIYDWVYRYIQWCGRSPTWQEIADGLDFKSKDQAWNCAKPLFTRGILGKNENTSRSIVVLVQPGNIFPATESDNDER